MFLSKVRTLRFSVERFSDVSLRERRVNRLKILGTPIIVEWLHILKTKTTMSELTSFGRMVNLDTLNIDARHDDQWIGRGDLISWPQRCLT